MLLITQQKEGVLKQVQKGWATLCSVVGPQPFISESVGHILRFLASEGHSNGGNSTIDILKGKNTRNFMA
jgi:hypothetical protein